MVTFQLFFSIFSSINLSMVDLKCPMFSYKNVHFNTTIFPLIILFFCFVYVEDRNNLEKLTLAVLSHLPTAVLFVHDLSGECGTSPSDQVCFYDFFKWLYKGLSC